MIKRVTLGEEIGVVTRNKVGILADIAKALADQGINIEAILGYEVGGTGKVFLVTSANLNVIAELRKKKYKSIKEAEVIIVELENKPGALKVVAMELKKKKIDIKYIYVTSCSSGGCSSKMVLQTSDNEAAMSLLSRYTEPVSAT